jgi:hypothetical protein
MNECFVYTKGIERKEGGIQMPKDSQPDNKRSRIKKAHGQTPITRENMQKIRMQKESQ